MPQRLAIAPTLSLVVPTYNERDRLPDLVKAIFDAYQAGGVPHYSIIDPATRTLNVEAEVANDKGELLPGAYADVTFAAPLAHGVTIIPASAVVLDSQGTRVAVVAPERERRG